MIYRVEDDISITVFHEVRLRCVGNQRIRGSGRRDLSMPYSNVVGRWMEVSVKLLVLWFVPNLQIEKI